MGTGQDVSILLLDAAVLMVVGMAVVFGFLMLLVLAVQCMSWLLRGSVEPLTANTTVQTGVSPAVVAAISAAIEHHQKQNKDIE